MFTEEIQEDPVDDLDHAICADLRTAHGLFEAIEYAATHTPPGGKQGDVWAPASALLLHIRDGTQIETHHMLALRKALQAVSEDYRRHIHERSGYEALQQCAGFPGRVEQEEDHF